MAGVQRGLDGFRSSILHILWDINGYKNRIATYNIYIWVYLNMWGIYPAIDALFCEEIMCSPSKLEVAFVPSDTSHPVVTNKNRDTEILNNRAGDTDQQTC